MRFVEVTELDSNQPVLINVNRVDLIYRIDDRTVIRIEQTDLNVKETVDEVLFKIRG